MVSTRLSHCKLIFFSFVDNVSFGARYFETMYPIAYQTFIHLFIYVSMGSSFPISFKELKFITIIIYLSQIWSVGAPLVGYNVLLTYPYHFRSLLIGTRCSRLTFYFPCPSPEINHFSRELWFLFVGNGI